MDVIIQHAKSKLFYHARKGWIEQRHMATRFPRFQDALTFCEETNLLDVAIYCYQHDTEYLNFCAILA